VLVSVTIARFWALSLERSAEPLNDPEFWLNADRLELSEPALWVNRGLWRDRPRRRRRPSGELPQIRVQAPRLPYPPKPGRNVAVDEKATIV
jgi:hypothetical protein